MTNINCSAACCNEKEGKCTLQHIGITAGPVSSSTYCTYFSPRANTFQQKDKNKTVNEIS